MCYSQANREESCDLHSGILRLNCQLDDMIYDAYHELAYGRVDEEFCNDLVKKYSKCARYCDEVLLGELNIENFIKKFNELKMGLYLRHLKRFFPESLHHLVEEIDEEIETESESDWCKSDTEEESEAEESEAEAEESETEESETEESETNSEESQAVAINLVTEPESK
jgi:hypothetical protein